MGQRTASCGVVPAANRGDYRMCGAGARPQIHSAAPPRAVGSAQACSVPARGQWALKSYIHAQPRFTDEKQRPREAKTCPRPHGWEARPGLV